MSINYNFEVDYFSLVVYNVHTFSDTTFHQSCEQFGVVVTAELFNTAKGKFGRVTYSQERQVVTIYYL